MPIDPLLPSIPMPYVSPTDPTATPSATVAKPSSSWDGKRMCEDENDPDPNCCCDGYSIESVIDQSYEYGLGDDPAVKRLEDYPCITCSDLDSIVDDLAAKAWAKDDKENPPEPPQECIPRKIFEQLKRFVCSE